jgi:hypothetical protein
VTLKKNLTSLANNTRPNIPLEIALQAVGANGEIPVNLNDLLDGHHYVTVLVMTTVIIIILISSTIGGVVITHVKGENRGLRLLFNYFKNKVAIMQAAQRNQELKTGGRWKQTKKAPSTITGNGLTSKRRNNGRALVRHVPGASSSNARRVPDREGPGTRHQLPKAAPTAIDMKKKMARQ